MSFGPRLLFVVGSFKAANPSCRAFAGPTGGGYSVIFLPLDVARETFGKPVSTASTSNTAADGFGTILAKDIVMWRSGDDVNIATVGYFVEAVTNEGRMHKALVHMHKRCGLAGECKGVTVGG